MSPALGACPIDRNRLVKVLRVLIFAVGLFAQIVNSAQPTVLPMLQIETGMHTGLIRKLAVDQTRSRAVTVADDKTLRVWRLPEIELMATHRVPANPGNEGQLFAVAIAPQGNTVAAGGWTGWDWELRGSVYLIDAATGTLLRRLSGFPNVIGSLAYSPDGRYLAVGLQGKGGLFVLALPEFKVVARDAAYGDKVVELDFDRAGNLAVSSLDGFIRVYTAELKLHARKRLAAGDKPATIRYSPDGTRLAVGFSDAAAVVVVSSRDLSLLTTPDLRNMRDQATLPALAWTHDGESICAGGDYRGPDQNPIYCWSSGGRGGLTKVPVVRQRLADFATLAAGGILFVAEDPAIGMLAAKGAAPVLRPSNSLDWGTGTAQLHVNNDGSLIQFDLPRENGTSFYFAVNEPSSVPAQSQLSQLRPALQQSAFFSIADWHNHYRPQVNGKVLPLENYEMSRAYAIASDESALLLGTEWALRLYDRSLNLQWMRPLSSVARTVTISGGNRFAIAALSDGTIRWFRMRDGVEVLALFVHAQSSDWICWTPQGYYMSSPLGDTYIGWQLNRGKEIAPDFFRAVQFERLLYRPDRVLAHFRQQHDALPQPLSDNAGFDIADLALIAPPRIELETRALEPGSPGHASLRISARKTALPMRDYSVFVNQIPVTPARERTLHGADADSFVRNIELELTALQNNVRVEVFNGAAMAIKETSIDYASPPGTTPARGNLYMLAIGVNQFPNLPGKYALRFAANDAREIAASMERHAKPLFASVRTRILTDETTEKPRRAAVLAALEFIKDAGARDTVIVFLAAHGISDTAGNYYFVPSDAAWSDVQDLLRGNTPKGNSLIAWTAFFDALRNSPGRRLLIVDTCQASNIEGTFDAHSLAKRSAASQFALMVAAQGTEDSQEYEVSKHGLFTHAVLEGLAGASDVNGDGFVQLQELFDYARAAVGELRDPLLGPQTPQLIAPPHLRDMPISKPALRAQSRKQLH